MNFGLAQWLLVLFVIVVAINAYMRFRVLKAYNFLQKQGLDFSARQLLDKQYLETQIIPKNQGFEKQIRDYVRFLKIGFAMTSILLLIIFSFAFILLRK